MTHPPEEELTVLVEKLRASLREMRPTIDHWRSRALVAEEKLKVAEELLKTCGRKQSKKP